MSPLLTEGRGREFYKDARRPSCSSLNMNCIFFSTVCPCLSDLSLHHYSQTPTLYSILFNANATIIPHPRAVPWISSPLNTRSILFKSGTRNILFSLVGRASGFFRVQNSLLERTDLMNLLHCRPWVPPTPVPLVSQAPGGTSAFFPEEN